MSEAMATCPSCAAPLIPTFAFRKFEFYCLECGRKVTYFGPNAADPTPELEARFAALKAEWDEHAGEKLIADGGWYESCSSCRVGGEPHSAHATADELSAHEAAIVWLRERALGGQQQ